MIAATCGWLGRFPFAPGTLGAAAGIALSAGLTHLGISPLAELAAVVALCALGIPICTAAARRMGRGADPGGIVWDEMASVPLGLLVIPAAERTVTVFVVAFVLHRIFDIWKPVPCRQLERLPGGLGIMADDWGAAAWMAAILLVARG